MPRSRDTMRSPSSSYRWTSTSVSEVLRKRCPRALISAAPPVVDREGEDAPQPRHHALALVLIQVDEHFRVGGAPEAVPARLELGREGAVVVDLAVVDDQDRSVLVAHRLRARGREVD